MAHVSLEVEIKQEPLCLPSSLASLLSALREQMVGHLVYLKLVRIVEKPIAYISPIDIKGKKWRFFRHLKGGSATPLLQNWQHNAVRIMPFSKYIPVQFSKSTQ